jgi:hypothetical protein
LALPGTAHVPVPDERHRPAGTPMRELRPVAVRRAPRQPASKAVGRSRELRPGTFLVELHDLVATFDPGVGEER